MNWGLRVLIGFLSLCIASGAEQEEGLLTRIMEVRSLTRAAAENGLPVRFECVVLLATPSGCFVHDGESSIWVERATPAMKPLWQVPPPEDFGQGSVILLEGRTVPGGYAPSIRPTAMRFMRRGKLPEPKLPSMELLVSGSEDCQWIELEGVVQDAVLSTYSRETFLTLATGGHSCLVTIQNTAALQPDTLVDARVRVRGVFSARPNLRGEIAGLRLFVSDEKSLEIIKLPPKDPFQSPHFELRNLLPFSVYGHPGHRKVTKGIVSFVYPKRFFSSKEKIQASVLTLWTQQSNRAWRWKLQDL